MKSGLDDEVTRIMPTNRPYALIDYPNHENVGDAAIWVGERALLRQHEREVAYVADIASYSSRALRQRIGPGGVILLHGGGNLGDLYPHHQALRESVITAFPRNQVIVMPQTATFRTKETIERTRRVFDGHPDLTVLVRDEDSLQLMQHNFSTRSLLAPDSAFALPDNAFKLGQAATQYPRLPPIRWLARTDAEAGTYPVSQSGDPSLAPDVFVTDWVGKRSASLRLVAWRQATLVSGGASRVLAARLSALDGWLARSYDELAAMRVEYGLQLLGRAQVIVTDRLHGHILALILGIPHVLLNDRYDKVGRFYRTWTRHHPAVQFASDPMDALSKARALLSATAPPMT
jgi:pyruvyl transferase EpsO